MIFTPLDPNEIVILLADTQARAAGRAWKDLRHSNRSDVCANPPARSARRTGNYSLVRRADGIAMT
jgi:hypothetical protein